MPNENNHAGDADKLVQADTVQGGVHFHDHRTRIRHRTWLVVLVCAFGLITASAVVLIRFQLASSGGPASPGGQAVPEIGRPLPHDEEPAADDAAFVNDGDCRAPAAPARKGEQGWLFNFMRTNDNTIVQNNQVEDFKRSDWVDIGGQAQGQPVAACGADDRMVVLAIAEGKLQVIFDIEHYERGSSAQPGRSQITVPAPPGSNGLVGVPAAVRDAEGELVIVARGNNGSLWARNQNSPDADEQSAWTELPHPVGDDPAIPVEDDPSIVLDNEERLRVFTLAQGEARAYTQESGSRTWRLAPNQPGTIDDPATDIRTTPSVIRDGSDCLHLFAATSSGTIARNKEDKCSDATWDDWVDLGMGRSGNRFVEESPIATRGPSNDIVVFALDSANKLHESLQVLNAEGEWSTWKSHETEMRYLVAVTPDVQDMLVAHGIGARDASGNVNLWAQNQKPASDGGGWTEWSPRIGGSGILHPAPNCAPDGEC